MPLEVRGIFIIFENLIKSWEKENNKEAHGRYINGKIIEVIAIEISFSVLTLLLWFVIAY